MYIKQPVFRHGIIRNYFYPLIEIINFFNPFPVLISKFKKMSKVLVTGATGFVALHVIGQMIEKSYSVIGTVRSQAKADKLYKQFKERFGDDVDLELVIVQDIAAENAFDNLFKTHKDIGAVLHTASPFSETETDDFEKGYKQPALEGTKNVLSSIKNFAPQVKKVVVTSSMATIMNFDKLADPTFTHSEDVWNPLEWEQCQDNWLMAYVSSKILAERAAWDFVKENKVNFSLTVVNPPYIYGPQYFDEDAKGKLNTSSQIMMDLISSSPDDSHLFNEHVMVSTDVRDVAAFHLIPLEREGVEGHRLLPIAENFSSQKILNLINEQFPELRGKIGKGDPAGESTIQGVTWNNDKTIKLVGGYDFIPLKKQVYDSVKQVLDARNS